MTLIEQLSLFPHEAHPPQPETSKISYFSKTLEQLNVQHAGFWQDSFGDSLQNWYRCQIKDEITTLSLFSGAGGLDIGFHDAGFSIHNLVEIDERFCATLRKNVSNKNLSEKANVHCLDIREYNADGIEKVDFIIGGPPCQTFSAAGRRAAGVAGLKDERGSLFSEYVRLLKKLQPKGFLFENVYGITGAEEGQAWKGIKEAFEKAGYQIQYRILDAADYGVPQHRERLFIVGMKEGTFLFPRPTHGPDSNGTLNYVSAVEVLHKLEVSDKNIAREIGGRYGHLLKEIPPGLNYSFFTEKMGHPTPVFAWRSKFSDFLYKAHPDMPVRTIKAQGGQYTGPFHWESRPFSISEFKRLQTFPDRYEIVGGRGVAIHQIGNSVTPQQARILAMAVLDQIFNVTPPYPIDYLLPEEELGFRLRKRQLTKVYSEIAEKALQQKKSSIVSYSFEERSYDVHLNRDFTLQENSGDKNNHIVSIAKDSNSYKFSIKNKQIHNLESYHLKIQPKDKESWGFDVDCLEIEGTFEEETFALSWRVLEHELRKNNIRPDLVQLNNYYQYEPSIHMELNLPETTNLSSVWRALQKTTLSLCTRSILSVHEIASLWEVSEKEVIFIAHKLKELGYEVRNCNTNIQIPSGHLLIPYAFPTLAKESVQRWKSLFKKEAKV